ncbi:hypothetical protein NDU88_003461 [Pleurodeles waltl]|uniref:Uncharacterized protein n=1 Tax=Pleurodeles waltl TaxID=8319 RepID=A0AAV7Q9Q2_PLEWA|nr:hypothetical protein NDU88_003461 [Pleurodeles waltl]
MRKPLSGGAEQCWIWSRRSPVVKTADPGKPVKEPPRFRRSVATPGTGVQDEEEEREAKKGGEVGKKTGTTRGALTGGCGERYKT